MTSTRAATSGILGTMHTIVSADVFGAVPYLSSILPAEVDVAGLFTTSAATIVVAIVGTYVVYEAATDYVHRMEEADEALLNKLSQR